ncbi:MAG: sialate O-acetylesterase [Verrucomicrobiota bacterium]
MRRAYFLFALSAILAGDLSAAEPSLPFVSPIFGDRMVLQRGKPNTIWGWARPGEKVTVEIAGRSESAVAGADGRWEARIRPPAPGGPYTVSVDGSQHVKLHEVLVGDVWLCGGQSNMQLPLSRTRNAADQIKAAEHPEIRFFIVHDRAAYAPAAVPQGSWRICSPQTVTEEGGLSAVAYFFARRLQEEIHVPIGLVQDCLGGTPAETWTSAGALKPLKDFDAALAEVDRIKARGGPQYGNYIMHWFDEYDAGIGSNNWAAATLDDSGWKDVTIPGGFAELGVPSDPSVCWFRREIVLPNPLPPGPARIRLGVVEKMDTTYINGQWVGASSWVENPRNYFIRDGVLKPGTNVVAIRVFKLKPDGGFQSKPESLQILLGDGTQIPLAGSWKGRLSVDARPPHPLPMGFENYPIMPSVLYQGMLRPVAPLAITGFLWYQGEANSERAWQYRALLPAMIQDWRQLFGQGDLPFYIVSLPAFMHHQDQPSESSWAELRDAQAHAARAVPHAALAVAIDTGDPDDIHPKDKQPVGERLALCALGEHYGKKVVFQGPTFKSAERVGNSLKLHFDHTDGGLVSKGGDPVEFAVAGSDRKWHWAEARIEGDSVVVSSTDVPEPVAARYAWQSFPKATLYNGNGLPAVPFRTDDWPLTTAKR